MTAQAEPTATQERIFDLDVIRGIALLGIFIMNMPYFTNSLFAGADGTHLWPQWWNRAAEVTRDVLFSGKFNSMFSMLFAIGFTIQFARFEQRDPSQATRLYIRRITWLLVFGVIHACLFWPGDILHMYALFGFVLLAIRRVSDKYLWIAIGACIIYQPLSGIVQLLNFDTAAMTAMMEKFHHLESTENIAYGHGGFLAAARENTATMIFLYSDPDILIGMSQTYAQIFSTMLIGMILGRRQFFADTANQLALIKRLQRWALCTGVATGLFMGWWSVHDTTPMKPSLGGVVSGTCYVLCRISMMAFYVASIVRGVHSPAWRRLLVPFSVTGRMPLTNYLMQTGICTTIFFSWGLGYWGTIGPALGILVALVIYFMVQMPLSYWWLSRFELGPMEYLWRRLTYGQIKSFRVQSTVN